MINHFRTFLLNQPAVRLRPHYGYEVVPADYAPRRRPNSAIQASRQLFGSNPDPLMLHFRGQQLTRVVESSILASHLEISDSRRTDKTDTEWPAGLFGARVTRLLDGAVYPVLSGSPQAPDASGVCLLDYVVEFQLPDSVSVICRTTSSIAVVTTVTISGGLTSDVPLLGCGVSVRCPSGAAGRWLVSVCAKPVSGVAELLSRVESLSQEVLLDLFGDSTQEPNKSWWNVWTGSRDSVDRLAAVSLAISRRTEDGGVA